MKYAASIEKENYRVLADRERLQAHAARAVRLIFRTLHAFIAI
jgi:hypothetical protein